MRMPFYLLALLGLAGCVAEPPVTTTTTTTTTRETVTLVRPEQWGVRF